IVRIIIVAVLVTYYATLAWLHDFSEPRFAWGALWAAGYLLVSIVYVGLIVAEPGISPARRLTACVTDFATLAVLLHWGQEAGTPLYPIYLWVTLGNGFRYGNRYLASSALVATVSLLLAVLTTPYLNSQPALCFGMVAGMIALPAYVATLIRKLTEAK